MKRLILLAVVLSVGCAVAGWRGRFDEQFAAAVNAWPTWSTTTYPLSKALAAYRRTFAEPDYVIGVMVAEDPLSYYSFEITE